MDAKDLQKQSESEGQDSTRAVKSDFIVCSRAIPRGDGRLVTEVTATELAREKSEEPKTTARDSDVNLSLSFPAMGSETQGFGGDYDPEIMTALSNEKTFEIKAENTGKENNSPVFSAFIISEKAGLKSDDSAGANTDANPSPYFTTNFGTESPAEDDNLENTTAIWNTVSSTSMAKKTTTKATSHNTTTTFMVNSIPNNATATATPNTNSNLILNAHGNINNINDGLPLMAFALFLIVGNCIIACLYARSVHLFTVMIYCLGVSTFFLLALSLFNLGKRNVRTRTSINVRRNYPPDSYSFMALYSPRTNANAFSFGFIVFMFQAGLFLLMILSVVDPNLRSGVIDNPEANDTGVFWAGFVPCNAEPLVRATQIIAILSSLVFPDASVLDICTAIEMFPRLYKRDPKDKVWCMAISCILRSIQGYLANFAVFLLVITSSNVKDVVLNFTAVNFISNFDEAAFQLAKNGRYGIELEEQAKQIEKEPLPKCSIPKHKYARYMIGIFSVGLVLLCLFVHVIFKQHSPTEWITTPIQIEFGNSEELQLYKGCYDQVLRPSSRRYNYKMSSDDQAVNRTQFGYCKKNRKWVLFTGVHFNGTEFSDPCLATPEDNELKAFSSTTDSFDIKTSFLYDTWYSASRTPLELVLIKNEPGENDCRSSPGNGVCNDLFNTMEFKFDQGDCCAGTCNHTECGKGGLNYESVFGKVIDSGDGFRTCIDPDPSMKPVTILLESISMSEPESNPFLNFYCDERNVFSIPVHQSMENNAGTFIVRDEANCTFNMGELQDDKTFSWEMNYSISDEKSDVLHKGYGSTKKTNEYFSVYNVLDKTFLPANVGSLLQGLKILDVDDENSFFTGSVPSTIGLMNKLTYLSLSNNDFTGSLPSEIGLLTKLTHLAFFNNTFNKNLPSELGLMNKLTYLGLFKNELTGSLPSHIGLMTKLTYLGLYLNDLTGTLPSEIGLMTALNNLGFDGNVLFGTLPSHIGLLTKLSIFASYDNQFTGNLPSQIGLLTKLSQLRLDGNTFTGSIPSQIGLLTEITSLNLDKNAFTGSLPSEIGLMNKLTFLNLNENPLTGKLTSQIGQLTKLTHFVLSGTAFTGSLPSQIGLLTELTKLTLNEAAFTGSIPSEIGLIDKLTHIELKENFFSGNLPRKIWLLTALQHLVVADNGFTGNLPSDVGFMDKLTHLDLRGIGFTGSLPSQIWSLTALTHLNLSDNDLPGSLPMEIGLLTKLNHLSLDGNALTGSLPSEIGLLTRLVYLGSYNNTLSGSLPSEIGLLTKLTKIILSGNNLTGSLPSQIGLFTGLTSLSLGGNALTGSLPSEIGLLTRLNALDLNGNQFSGSLPSEIGLLTKLEILGLHDNALSGNLPSQIGLLTQLNNLGLNGNHVLTGNLPSQIGLLTTLSFLGLYDNTFNGSLPSEIGLLTKLNVFALSNNLFTGSLPSEIGLLTTLNYLGLYDNSLTGSLPSEIGFLTKLTIVALSGNYFTGSLPSWIVSLTTLSFLGLYDNVLTGSIPSKIGLLTTLNRLYLNDNALTGSIPSKIGLLTTLNILYLNGNAFTGSLPSEIGLMNKLNDLIFYENAFTGRLPSELGSLINLFYPLDFTRNDFSCPIPQEIYFYESDICEITDANDFLETSATNNTTRNLTYLGSNITTTNSALEGSVDSLSSETTP